MRRKSGRIESDRQKQMHRTRAGGVHPVRMISTIHAHPDARVGYGGAWRRFSKLGRFAANARVHARKIKKNKKSKKEESRKGSEQGENMALPNFTEDQEQFVVSWLIAFHDDRRIARDFLEFYPHFNGAVDKAECEQLIRSRCYQFRTDPKLPQYKIIREGRKHRGDDCTHIPFTHKRWRDHKRQNIFDKLEDLTDRITAGEFQDNKKKAKLLIDCVLVRQKILDDYDKREATRRQLYESTEVH